MSMVGACRVRASFQRPALPLGSHTRVARTDGTQPPACNHRSCPCQGFALPHVASPHVVGTVCSSEHTSTVLEMPVPEQLQTGLADECWRAHHLAGNLRARTAVQQENRSRPARSRGARRQQSCRYPCRYPVTKRAESTFAITSSNDFRNQRIERDEGRESTIRASRRGELK